MKAKIPQISILIATLNEEKNIKSLLDMLLEQDVNADYEIIISDGMSSDNTRQIINEYANKHPDKIKLILNPQISQNHGFNQAIKLAHGKYLALLSAHSVIQKNYLANLYESFLELQSKDKNPAGVGGVLYPANKPGLSHTIGLAMNTFFGGGISRFRYIKNIQQTTTIVYGFYDKHALDKLNPFMNEKLKIAEDLDLNIRLNKLGFHLYTIPTIKVGYIARNSYKSLFGQIYKYGKARAIILNIHYPRLFYVVKFILAVLIISLLVFPIPSILISSILYITHLILLVFFSVQLALTQKISFFETMKVYFILHLSFVIGFAYYSMLDLKKLHKDVLDSSASHQRRTGVGNDSYI